MLTPCARKEILFILLSIFSITKGTVQITFYVCTDTRLRISSDSSGASSERNEDCNLLNKSVLKTI
jgi:hypothetical protein